MMIKKNPPYSCTMLLLSGTVALVCLVFLVSAGCHSVATPSTGIVHHQAMISRPGESIYVDRVSNRAVIEPVVDTGVRTSFCSFLVGWEDSSSGIDKDRQRERERYFQYDMQKDWVALVKGDSLYPVFFQGKPALNQQLREGVMVFELSGGTATDTLVYKGSYGTWGIHLFVLNTKSANRHVQD